MKLSKKAYIKAHSPVTFADLEDYISSESQNVVLKECDVDIYLFFIPAGSPGKVEALIVISKNVGDLQMKRGHSGAGTSCSNFRLNPVCLSGVFSSIFLIVLSFQILFYTTHCRRCSSFGLSTGTTTKLFLAGHQKALRLGSSWSKRSFKSPVF